MPRVWTQPRRLYCVCTQWLTHTILIAWSQNGHRYRLILSYPQHLWYDLHAASWICYRGSTVAFQGILAFTTDLLNPDDSNGQQPVAESKISTLCRYPSGPDKYFAKRSKGPQRRAWGITSGIRIYIRLFFTFRPDIAVTHIKNCLSWPHYRAKCCYYLSNQKSTFKVLRLLESIVCSTRSRINSSLRTAVIIWPINHSLSDLI